MTTILQEKWENHQILGRNAVVFEDGKLIILDILKLKSPEGSKARNMIISPLCDTTIQSIMKYDSDPWVDVIAMKKGLNLVTGEKIIYGMGDMGNEGFIALLNKANELQWSIFLTCSNPFIEIKTAGDSIIAYNNDNLAFTLSLNNPESITVQNLTP